MTGVALPFTEIAISLSVVVLGLAVALQFNTPTLAAASVSGFFAVFHGFAHGAEMPASTSGLFYGLGFVCATVLLHATGVGLGVAIGRMGRPDSRRIVQVGGATISAAGVALLLSPETAHAARRLHGSLRPVDDQRRDRRAEPGERVPPRVGPFRARPMFSRRCRVDCRYGAPEAPVPGRSGCAGSPGGAWFAFRLRGRLVSRGADRGGGGVDRAPLRGSKSPSGAGQGDGCAVRRHRASTTGNRSGLRHCGSTTCSLRAAG